MGIRFNQMVAGDTWTFTSESTDYPAGTWTLTLYLVPRFTSPVQGVITLTSAPDGTDSDLHRFTETAAATAVFAAGKYSYHVRATDGTQKFTLDGSEWNGEVEILADPAGLTQGHDGRSDAQRALDDARAALYNAQARARSVGEAGIPVEYQVGDRRMKYGSPQEAVEAMIRTIQHLEAEVFRDRRADAIRRGLADPRQVYVRTYRA